MTSELAPQPLIRTKLHRPGLPGDLVARPGLVARLEQGSAALTLVSAPAGYGKSTLLSTWLASRPGPSAWFTADAADDDIVAFLVYWLAAIDRAAPGAVDGTRSLLNGVTPPNGALVAGTLATEIDGLDAPPVLVLDDFHHIQRPEIHECLAQLLYHRPRGLKLVIATRYDPPLPLAALRARGQLAEFRSADLRLSSAELAILVRNVAGPTVERTTIARWRPRTKAGPLASDWPR